jgi:antirestriction protein
MTNQESEIRIYVACLAAYNNGILHGRWIDAHQDTDDIYAAIREMLKASPIAGAEEWAIHDYEGFEGLYIAEYQGIEQVADFAAFIAEHGELGAKLVNHYGSLEAARETLEDYYAGEYSSLADFAQEMTESSTTIPDSLRYYIDWESMARDMEINDVLAIHLSFDRVHVFWSH